MQNKREQTAKYIFAAFGFTAVAAVAAISIYLIVSGLPALVHVGAGNIIFGTVWRPVGEDALFGILPILLASLLAAVLATLFGVPFGVLTAVFLTDYTAAKKSLRRIGDFLLCAVELLASVPSVIYGLLGMVLLNPLIFRAEMFFFGKSDTHQFTGGANFLSAVLMLTIMIFPTVTAVAAAAIKSVPVSLRAASYALGANKLQTIFRVVLPAARSGISAGAVLGVGRALGEAMAVNMVAGGTVNFPLPFNSVRLLTTQLVSELGYAAELHREVLFTVALVLYVFIVAVNLLLRRLKKGAESYV